MYTQGQVARQRPRRGCPGNECYILIVFKWEVYNDYKIINAAIIIGKPTLTVHKIGGTTSIAELNVSFQNAGKTPSVTKRNYTPSQF